MNATQGRPQHASYNRHRRQFFWQILLPILVAGLLMVGMIYLVFAATFHGNGDVDRWASISTIWLVIPVMIGGLFVLVAVSAIAYLIGYAAGFIPPLTHQAQGYAFKMEAAARRVGEIGHKPALIVPEIGKLLKLAFQRIRGG